jgi:hypothetical protein
MCIHVKRQNARNRDESFAGNYLYTNTAIPNFTVSTSGVVLSETIRAHLIPDFVRTLVDNNDLQALLKEDRDYKIMIGALVYPELLFTYPGYKPKGLVVGFCVW